MCYLSTTLLNGAPCFGNVVLGVEIYHIGRGCTRISRIDVGRITTITIGCVSLMRGTN